MKTPITLIACLCLHACQSNEPFEDPSTIPAEEPKGELAALVGQVLHPNGRPLQGIAVTVHTGFATRFPIGTTKTDAEGKYRFELDPTLSSSTSDSGSPVVYLGVYVGSVRNVNPPEVVPWKDIQAENAPGTLTRLDFEFDPESVPMQYRD